MKKNESISSDVISLLKLYYFIDKINDGVANWIKRNESEPRYILEDKENFKLTIEKEKNHYWFKIVSSDNGKDSSYTIRLRNGSYPIDKQVINKVRSHIHKKLNEANTTLYSTEFNRQAKTELITILNRNIRGRGRFGLSNTQSYLIDLQYPFDVSFDVTITGLCRFFIFHSGIDVSIKQTVYGLVINEHQIKAVGPPRDLVRKIINNFNN